MERREHPTPEAIAQRLHQAGVGGSSEPAVADAAPADEHAELTLEQVGDRLRKKGVID